MKPIKIAILWHQHQPVYNYEENGFEEYILPWVRFHAVKDYLDLPLLLHNYPTVKQTFNLVPSLLFQLEEYTTKKVTDKAFRLSRKSISELTFEDKKYILNNFFTCNLENMIIPYPRYKYLYEKNFGNDNAVNEFTNDELLDLQVWYNLTWIGEISRKNLLIQRLIDKGKNFNEIEKNLLLDYHLELMANVLKQYKQLYKLEQIDIAVSPFYHPILPLVIHTDTAKESLPNLQIEPHLYSYPEDAQFQINLSKEYVKSNFDTFDFETMGMWPSEGSISNSTLDLFIGNDIKWVATDETIYFNSTLKDKNDKLDLEKYFPKLYTNKDGKNISIYFRDHVLSDKIGFLYSNWDAETATNDFINYILNIRNNISQNFGEIALDDAVVTIILDGENCWEFYKNNGFDFLNTLYSRISNENLIETVTFSETTKYVNDNLIRFEKLTNIKAGSWINGNFKIWIGHPEDQIAWKMLSDARKLFENVKHQLSPEKRNLAYKYILIAEGSDWFWWFGDEHTAPNSEDFDLLFRYNVKMIYNIIKSEIEIDIPKELNYYIMQKSNKQIFAPPSSEISPLIDGIATKDDLWYKSGFYNVKSEMQSMHQSGEIISKINYGNDKKYIYFKIETVQRLALEDEIIISINYPVKIDLKITALGFFIFPNEVINIQSIRYAIEEVIEVAIDKSIFDLPLSKTNDKLKIIGVIYSKSKEGDIRYPRFGEVVLDF